MPPLWLAYGCAIVRSTRGGGRLGDVRIAGARAILGDHGVAAGVGVVDVEAAVARVVGMEREPEQALLAALAGERR